MRRAGMLLSSKPMRTTMLDILLLPGGLGLFALLALYVHACGRV